MSLLDVVLLVIAGVGGGLAGSVAGLASLVSYPALLAVGLPPVTANVTNTVALVASSAGSTLGSRLELTGQRRRVKRLAVVSVAGGAVGGLLLLVAPASSFALVVPWLIAAASLGILLRPRVPAPLTPVSTAPVPTAPDPRAPVDAGADDDGRGLSAATFVVAVYGGYFGAAAGVMMLSLLLLRTGESLPRSNAAKNLLLGMANAVAAVAFIIFGPVRWEAVVPLAAGFLAGGWVGPRIVRRTAAGPLRAVIALAGLGLAVHLGLDAY